MLAGCSSPHPLRGMLYADTFTLGHLGPRAVGGGVGKDACGSHTTCTRRSWKLETHFVAPLKARRTTVIRGLTFSLLISVWL